MRDLAGRQAADRAQRQRNGRRRRERRMTAHEEEDERVVVVHIRLEIDRGNDEFRLQHHSSFSGPSGGVAAQLIGHATAGDLNQPAARIVRNALAAATA